MSDVKETKIVTTEKDGCDCTDPQCPYCKSGNVYGMSRVVGYFSKIDNWNKSKQTEFKARQEGNYWSDNIG